MSHMGRIYFEREEPSDTGEFARGFLNGLLLATVIWGVVFWGAVFAAAFATGAL